MLRRLLPAVLLGLLALPAQALADRDFTPRYSANDTGDIRIAANTLMTCPPSAACTQAQNAPTSNTASVANLSNNAHAMTYVDVDGDATTFSSSRATFVLPAGATVLFAGLYYGGDYSGTGANAPPAVAQRNRVKFRAPGDAGYATLTAAVVDESTLNIGRYQGFVDVTARVAAAGSGSYTVADVQSGKGSDHYAGWSLVVAYRDTNEPARSLTVFDGLKTIRSNDAPTTIPVSGFRTPPAGPVRTSVGFVVYEGDLGITGDTAALNATTLGDAQSPASNFFNSSISTEGVRNSAKAPDFSNQLGYDSDVFAADGILPNGATSATIRVTTSGDQYLPGVITFATELFAPRIEQAKAAVDLNGGLVEQGDVVEYRITGTNTGQDGAAGFVLDDAIPANTTYVPGSLQVSGPTPQTDAAGDDRAEFRAAANAVRFRLGTGANATVGGRIAPGASYEARFRVVVGRGLRPGAPIPNTARSSFFAESLGTPLTAESTATVAVASPDLSLAKRRTVPANGGIVPGSPVAYELTVTNVGTARVQPGQTVTVRDTLPPGLSGAVATGAGWSCSVVGSEVTCTRADALAAGAAHPTITVTANTAANLPTPVKNTATVSGGGDGNPDNDSATDPAPVNPMTDLSVVKSADRTVAVVGDVIIFTLAVRNGGPSDATDVAVADTLPPGLELVSAVPSQGTCSTTIACALGELAAGASASVVVRARVLPPAAGAPVTNTARVSGGEPDPNAANDTGSATVAVGGIDLAVTKTVSPASPTAGGPISFTITLGNDGPSGATGVTLRDLLPAELRTSPAPVVTAPAGVDCPIVDGAVVCSVGALAAGAQVVVRIDGTVRSDASGRIANTASARAVERDPDPSDDSATAEADVATSADLSLDKEAPGVADVEGEITYLLRAANAGPSVATGVVIADVLPVGVTFVSASSGCTPAAATRTVTCVVGTLADGASATRQIVVRADPGTAGALRNTASIDGDQADPDPANDASEATTSIPQHAGLSVQKTVTPSSVAPGGQATYTFVVANAGPASARDVLLSDPFPAGVRFVSSSPGAPTCSFAAGTLTCALGTIAPGASRTVTAVAEVEAPAPAAPHDHLLPVGKVEESVAFEPGETRTVELTCGPGRTMTDASLRVDAVDQGQGAQEALIIRRLESTAPDRYAITAQSTSGGRAQGTAFGLCVDEQTTEALGHRHALVQSAPVSQTQVLQQGRTDVEVVCGPGAEPVAPGFAAIGGSVRLVASEPTSGGWRFSVEVADDPADVTVSVRCLNRRTSVADGHAHDLDLEHTLRAVVVGPGQVTSETVTCADDAKGIVATYDLDTGVVPLGNDPQPKSRVFRLSNPGAAARGATIDLTCLGDRVGPPVAADVALSNTATVSSSTPDDDASDNASTATLTRTGAPAAPPVVPDPGPAGPTGPDAPRVTAPSVAPVAPSGAARGTVAPAIGTTALRLTGVKAPAVAVPVRCAAGTACAGTVVLTTARSLTVAGKRLAPGRRLASGTFRLRGGEARGVAVALPRAVGVALRRQGTRTLVVEVRRPDGAVAAVRRLALRP